MSEPAVQLDGISEATEEMRGVAGQALEWVRVSEERVAEAEAARSRAGSSAELKQRAMETLRKIGDEGRERIAAEREKRTSPPRAAPPPPSRPATGPRRPSSRRAGATRPIARRWPPR